MSFEDFKRLADCSLWLNNEIKLFNNNVTKLISSNEICQIITNKDDTLDELIKSIFNNYELNNYNEFMELCIEFRQTVLNKLNEFQMIMEQEKDSYCLHDINDNTFGTVYTKS